ncbi:aminopeptidase [Solibacillus silvestris]|uniref:aminopeptidase n=1 Tax=Solibacillus silvestris TaxID=76853 RepID=UPI003F80C76E
MIIHQLEYRGLNLLDGIGTVEIAINPGLETIHIYDTNYIVEPEYDFSTGGYTLSEGFWKMAKAVKEKQFLKNNDENNLNLWTESFKWVFYSSNRSMKIYEKGEIVVFKLPHIEKDIQLYEKYFSRLKEE